MISSILTVTDIKNQIKISLIIVTISFYQLLSCNISHVKERQMNYCGPLKGGKWFTDIFKYFRLHIRKFSWFKKLRQMTRNLCRNVLCSTQSNSRKRYGDLPQWWISKHGLWIEKSDETKFTCLCIRKTYH